MHFPRVCIHCKQNEIVSSVQASELLNLRLPRVTSADLDTDPSLPSGPGEEGREEVGMEGGEREGGG